MVDSRLIRYTDAFYAAAAIIPHPAPPMSPRWNRENREYLQKKLEETPVPEGEGMEERGAREMSASFEAHKAQKSPLYQAALKASKALGIPAQTAFALIGDHYNQTGEIPYLEGTSQEIEKEVNKLVNEYGMTEEDARSIVESQFAAKGQGPEVVEHLLSTEVERVAALRRVFKYASPTFLKWAARF